MDRSWWHCIMLNPLIGIIAGSTAAPIIFNVDYLVVAGGAAGGANKGAGGGAGGFRSTVTV